MSGTDPRVGVNGYAPPAAVRLQFTSKERDAETGLHYFGARYMASAQGRFTSADPFLGSGRMAEPQTWNRYAYAGNNPLRFVDPNGLDYYDQNGNNLGTSVDGQNYIVTNAAEIQQIKKSTSTVQVSSLSSTALLPSPAVSAEILAAVGRSNSKNPAVGDTKGGFHEEGGLFGLDSSGKEVVVAAAPGQANMNPTPGGPGLSIDIAKAANPQEQGKVFDPRGGFHIHPGGTTASGGAFKQVPSPADHANAVFATNIVVGVGTKTVYFYNTTPNQLITFPLTKLKVLK